ncbi:MAG: hypothetical protein ACKOD1_06595, partial [Sphingomonadales bacterium]
MKKIISAIVLLFLLQGTRAQDQRGTDLDHCLASNPVVQSLIKPYLEQFLLLDAQLESDVQALIESERISNQGGVLFFKDLAAVVRTAESLQELDQRYDDFFATAARALASRFAAEGLCNRSLDAEVYREAVLDYLELEVFRPKDDRASVFFAKQLEFESVRVMMNAIEKEWLTTSGNELAGDYPGFDQPVNEEFYWPLLNREFDLRLIDPEPALQQMTFAKQDNQKFKEILQFIFDNWTEIKGILDWLNNNLFYDCKPSVTARIRKDKDPVPAALSPSVQRQYRYAVSQNGVLMDGKSTRTRIKASLKLYKKRPIGWARDKISTAGINYCSLQWNACEQIPWPANGVPFFQMANHQSFKTKLNQQHPHA